MCMIAGYAGKKTAAPILIEMLKKEEFIDGGLSTGIATIHEGKLYTAKVIGDVDTLLRETNALELPGTVGIIHSRTAGNFLNHAHPFLSADEELALVLNGTFREVMSPGFMEEDNAIMREFYERGIEIRSAVENPPDYTGYRKLPTGQGYHSSECYALMVGDQVARSSDETIGEDLVNAVQNAVSRLPADIVLLGVHARLPDTITVGDVTRSMVCGYGDGEMYLATSALAFPEEVQKRPVTLLPPCSIAQVTPKGVTIRNEAFDGVRVEPITPRALSIVRERLEKILTGQKDAPVSTYDIPLYEEWREIWTEPYVDCKFASPTGLLKPYATIIYEVLWGFH